MKYLFFYIPVMILLMAITANVHSDTAVKKTVKIKCEEMTCQGCKSKITESVKTLKGIKNINIDLTTKIIVVTFDDKKTNTDAIIAAIAEAGYESVLIE